MNRLERSAGLIGLVGALISAIGCAAGQPNNPSFSLSPDRARTELKRMVADPKPLRRPVVVLGGYLDFGINRKQLDKKLARIFDEDQLLGVSYALLNNYPACRERTIKRVQERWPSQDPNWTIEVDVIGFSLGGLVARDAAAPPEPGDRIRRRLKIHTLYTVSAPHRGAQLSGLPSLDPIVANMRMGSSFIERLDKALLAADYDMVCYVRLGDDVVGEENAAPAGRTPWWLPKLSGKRTHADAHRDPRIVADIARRLRGERPYTTNPPAPIPVRFMNGG